jgi:hypothetical protein
VSDGGYRSKGLYVPLWYIRCCGNVDAGYIGDVRYRVLMGFFCEDAVTWSTAVE